MTHKEHESCIDACNRCAEACDHCSNACLDESNVTKMAECIRLDRECADACRFATATISRGSQFMHEVCRLCADICDACGKECRKHDMDHCQECADACERCAEECRAMAGSTV